MGPRIAITLGDPAGVGPEIVCAALLEREEFPADCEFIILGETDGHTAGQPTEASAQSAYQSLRQAAEGLRDGHFDGVVTGPVCKRAMHAVGFPYPGQTEFFADAAGAKDFAMCLTGGSLTVGLVTAHVPLSSVPGLLSEQEIVRVGRLLEGFFRQGGVEKPRIAVAGLNPHAGEEGDLGREEQLVIAPAVARLGTNFSGPFSPDTIFLRAVEGEFHAVLCMYHDQGLIPLKLHAFDRGVNVTLGLPFPRTSPDHGTAFALAGSGKARAHSMKEAIRLCAGLATRGKIPAGNSRQMG